MRRVSQLLALGALGAPAAALLKRSPIPQETSGLEYAQNIIEGMSPKPTDAPVPRFGRMNLLRRLDEYTLGPGSCAFVSSDGDPFTCVNTAATCSNENGYMGCCEPNKLCNVIKTTCIDYSASLSGACDYPDDFHTLCCASSASGSCFTFVMPTTGTDGSSSTATALICSNREAVGTLLDYDPAWSRTHIFSTGSTTTTSSSSTSVSTTPPPPPSGGGTNVGAIAGGTVGGVAALGLVGLAAFLFLRHRKKNSAASTPTPVLDPSTQQSPSTQMAQTIPTSPNQNFPPTSPAGTAYPSGVPSNYQGYQPQGYDPNMGGYNQQQGNFSPQTGYNTYSPPPPFQQGQYAPPQQGQYNYAGGYQASSASPPPGVSPSPAKEVQTPPETTQQSHPPQELDAVNPVGNETNRAELG